MVNVTWKGKKVQELGGNAVIGYKQSFDLEEENQSITARAIGTAVRFTAPDSDRTLWPLQLKKPPVLHASSSINITPLKADTIIDFKRTDIEPNVSTQQTPLMYPVISDMVMSSIDLHNTTQFKAIDIKMYTMTSFPLGAISGIGGLVSATSIKVIDNDEKEMRDHWWTELRDEIKSHAKVLSCTAIIG